MDDEARKKEYEAEEQRIAETIAQVTHRIAVFSGKGGVGKTTVSVNLAFCFHTEGCTTGILDADITGPNVPKMLGIDDQPIFLSDRMIPFERDGVKMISMAGLLKKGQALIWRGPMRSKVIHQFLADVEWGPLDYMIADLPPGTGDEILSIGQQMKPDFAVIVTTPQEVSLMDAERAVRMARELKIPHIGIVENMSGMLCPHCGKAIDMFGQGGGKKLAEQVAVDFLGAIPVDIDVRVLSDAGQPFVGERPQSPAAASYRAIVERIRTRLDEQRETRGL